MRHDATLTSGERDRAVDDPIALVAAVDGILRAQAAADARYFAVACERAVDEGEARAIETAFLSAYRWQYIQAGVQHPRFGKVLASLITGEQGARIQAALGDACLALPAVRRDPADGFRPDAMTARRRRSTAASTLSSRRAVSISSPTTT